MYEKSRSCRRILSNKWMLCIYPIIVTILFILYGHCRYVKNSNHCNEFQKRNFDSIVTINTISSYLFIFIMTSPSGFVRRKAMRETWLKKKGFNGLVIEWRFIIGTKGLSSVALKELQQEQQQYFDLLFLPNHEDSYKQLTSKLLKTLIWMNSNVQATYFMKADDDTFAQLHILTKDMQKREYKKRQYWGFFRGNSNVKRTGQWAEKNWFLSDHYLPYALGGGYILTSDLIEYISRISDMLQTYNSEDASMGVWLAPVKLNRFHDVRFDTEYKSRGCRNDYVVLHKQNVEDMYEKYDNLLRHNKLCKLERELLYTFDYNWNVPPSQCCKRIPYTNLKNSSYLM